MSILTQLSSSRGDRTEASNKRVALACQDDPELLKEIAAGLSSTDAVLAGDCAEVMTNLAQDHPDLVAPYAGALVPLVHHKGTRVRWEAHHALAYVANRVPVLISNLLPDLHKTLQNDASIIVRDYTVDIIANYASTSPEAAREAYPLLVDALSLWNGKQAGHALAGLLYVARQVPEYSPKIREQAAAFTDHPRGVVRKAATALLKAG